MMLEQLTPFTGIFFAYTNAVGAALWAYDMEHDNSPDQELKDLQEGARMGGAVLAGKIKESKFHPSYI